MLTQEQLPERRRPLRALKRGIYLATSLLGVLAILSVLAFHLVVGSPMGIFYWLALPPLAVALAFLSLVLWRDRLPLQRLESLKLGLLSLFFLGDFAYAFLLGSALRAPPASLVWAPLIWLLAAFIYMPRQALWRSSLLVGSSLAIVLAALFPRPDHLWPALGYRLLLFYLVSAVMIGLLYLFSRLQHDYAKLERFAEEMHHSAHTDTLTGIANRRALEELLELECLAAEREGRSFSVILFDIDHFKRVNDTYGHDVGDEVLKQIAATAQRQLRRSDRLGRWGGEEFLVVASHGSSAAFALAERLRQAVHDARFHGVGFQVTISFGVASYTKGDRVEKLLKRADAALYRAKQEGRNRVGMEARASVPL